MPTLGTEEKKRSAKLASKIASLLSSDVAMLAKENVDPLKINLIITNAFNILQGLGLANVAISEALSSAGVSSVQAKSTDYDPQIGDKVWYGGQVYTVTKTGLKHSGSDRAVELRDKKGATLVTVPGLDPRWGAKPGKKLKSLLDVMWGNTSQLERNEMNEKTLKLRKYLIAHPKRKKAVIATLLRHGQRRLATAASRMVLAKKPHFKLSSYAEEYEDQVAMLAANNYGLWEGTDQAEQFVKKAVHDLAKEKYNDVIESFGKDDIKYIVEMHLYQDEADPYRLDPPDPKVGKAIQKVLESKLGKDWKKASGYNTAEKHGMMREADDDPKAWVVWIEGHGVHNVDSMWQPILDGVKKAGFRDASAEPYDNVTIIVHPEAD